MRRRTSELVGLPAPALSVSKWFNADKDISLEKLKGSVVVIESFQMLCPGCVSHGLPQAQRIQQTFRDDQVVVLGLHTVFEHHEAMTPTSLEAFLYEYRITFPVGVDQQRPDDNIPETMGAYKLGGTPSLTILDKAGIVRFSELGQTKDLIVGALIGQLVEEPSPEVAKSH